MTASSCARCGLAYVDHGELTPSGVCPGPAEEQLACRDRELSNVRALLRSQTRKLERIQEMVGEVLEVLS